VVQPDGKAVVVGSAFLLGQGIHLELARFLGDHVKLSAWGTPVQAFAGKAFTSTLALFTDSGAVPGSTAGYQATIDWGDGTRPGPDLTAGQIAWVSGHLFRVTGSHTYAAAGLYTVHVTIKAADRTSATATATAFVGETASSGILGVALVGPTVPVVRPGEPDTRPLPGAIISVQPAGGGREIRRVAANQSGFFDIALPPGKYLIVPLPPASGASWPRANPRTVVVKPGELTPLVVLYDSGIR
jgi:hypothetical protein